MDAGFYVGKAHQAGSILIIEDMIGYEREFGIHLGDTQPLVGFSHLESEMISMEGRGN